MRMLIGGVTISANFPMQVGTTLSEPKKESASNIPAKGLFSVKHFLGVVFCDCARIFKAIVENQMQLRL